MSDNMDVFDGHGDKCACDLCKYQGRGWYANTMGMADINALNDVPDPLEQYPNSHRQLIDLDAADTCACRYCKENGLGWYKYRNLDLEFQKQIKDKLNVLLKNAEYQAQKEAMRQQAEKVESAEQKRYMGSIKKEEMADVIPRLNNRYGIAGDASMIDPINSPGHYAYSGLEPIEVIEKWGLNYTLGSCVKYLCRKGKKDPSKELEDLKKARWFLDREISNLEKKVETEKAALINSQLVNGYSGSTVYASRLPDGTQWTWTTGTAQSVDNKWQ